MHVIFLSEKKKTFSVCNTHVCIEKGVLPGAVISRRERNDFFPMAESTPVGKSDRRFGARSRGWSFAWINARAETTLLSADAVAHFVFLGIQTYIRRRNTRGLSDLDTRVHTRIGRSCGWIRDWTGMREGKRKKKRKSPFRHWSSWTLWQARRSKQALLPFYMYILYIPQVLGTEN